MNTKLTMRRYFGIVMVVLLFGCTPRSLQPTLTSAPTFTPFVLTPTTSPTFTPSLTLVTASPTALPASLPKFPLDGYVMVFTRDGDLYFQDGNNSPTLLINNLGNQSAILSNDNQKVAFSRADGSISSINSDGTNEQVIIPKGWTDSLEMGTRIYTWNFIPKTHLLFFDTILCKLKSSISTCSTSIFLADTDTGKIKKLADLGLAEENNGQAPTNIVISPDGKMIAVGTMDGMEIFTLDGKVICRNVLPYKTRESYPLFPSLFWLPDSSGLIVALPNAVFKSSFSGDITGYTIWRYKLENNSTVQISFDPPVAGTMIVSPDGKWIAYGVISLGETEIYLGDLANGNVKVIGNDLYKYFSWSPDSKRFIHGQTVVLSFDKPPVFGGALPWWVDSNHFIYDDLLAKNQTVQRERLLMAEIKGDEIDYYELGLSILDLKTIKPKQ